MRRQLMRLALENAFVNVNQPPSHEDALIMSFRKEFGHLYPTPPVVIEHNPLGRPYLTMEEIANGQPVKEIEHTIYARVINPSELDRAASKEHQEQWEIRVPKTDKNAGKGSMRVRKTWNEGKEDEAVYVRTSKVTMNDKGDKIELPLPSNKDEFTIFKFLSEQGMKKVRFTFPIIGTDLKWEIDMFPKADGSGFHEWCKIDLEVRDREQPIPEFPIALDDVILPVGYGRQNGDADEIKVRELYDSFFLTKNEFLPKAVEPAEGSSPSAAEQGIATATPVESSDSSSDEAPEPTVSAEPPEPAAGTTDVAEHERLSQALSEPNPENLQAPAEPRDAAEPNGAEPQGHDTTPEQAEDNLVEDGLPTKPKQPDNGIEASDADVPPTEEEQAEAEQAQTQAKVDQIQAEKKAEAQSQGEPDPTEGGKVPVDLIDNPAGDPSVATEPESEDGAGTSGDTTGAADGSNPDENGEGTGDGLGGELPDGAGTTGTEASEPNGQGEAEPTADTANASNGEGQSNAEVNGEDHVAANAPQHAQPDEVPPENDQGERRPEEATQ